MNQTDAMNASEKTCIVKHEFVSRMNELHAPGRRAAVETEHD